MKIDISLIRATFLILWILVFLPLQGWAQAPVKGKSTIKVHAIYDDNERPVRRARVAITLEEAPFGSRRGITDAKGDVTFNNVAAGSYKVSLMFTNFRGGGSDVVLAKGSATVDGSSRSDLTLRAKRAGALTGKITYSDGEPAISARVWALVRVDKQWRPVFREAETDDRGVYRIYPIQEGEYLVSAVEEGWVTTQLPEGGESQRPSTISVSPYYYGGTSLKTAEVIQVEAGREVSNLNITLTERALFKLSGTVLGAGVPLPGVPIALRVRDDNDPSSPVGFFGQGTRTESDQKGAWSFNDVPEGSYYVEVINEQRFEPKPSEDRGLRRFVWEPFPVTVSNGDVENVLISASEGARVSGTVTVEGDKPAPPAQISLKPTTGYGMQSSRYFTQTDPRTKGEFSIEGIAAGEHFLLVSVYSGTHYVKSVVWNNRDLLRFPLVLSEGNERKGVRVVLGDDPANARGRLTNADHSPVSQKVIMFVPFDEQRWNTITRNFARTDRQGNFIYQGAPGEYGLIFVPSREDANRWMDYAREQMRRAPRVTLKPGEQNLNEIVMPAP